jgi:assimilatory nitrate reductase catalytic subunit
MAKKNTQHNTVLDKLPFPASLLFQRTGTHTRDLVRDPAPFGLGQLPKNQMPNATTAVTCGFCSTGCSLEVHLKDQEAINLTPNTHYPVNLGQACPKGWEALNPLDAPNRATAPMERQEDGSFAPISWDSALDTFCNEFKAIQEKHGPESVAFLSTGQICTEEMALLGAVTKFGMGCIHGDGNTRQCMATAVTAYKESFGFDAPPYSYQDFEESDVLVFIGANPCIAHPIMWERVCRNKNNPEIHVVDPRKTETAEQSTHHYPLNPKSDLPFFYAIANELIQKGWIDTTYIEKHTTDFREFIEHVKDYSLETVSTQTGISVEDMKTLVESIHNGKKVSFWWTMGVNQGHEATRTAQAIINIALMTGNIGRPGTGANSITGQTNAMGSRLFSNTTSLLGGRNFTSKEDRKDVAELLGIDEAHIPTQNSLSYYEILEGLEKGTIKGLWIIATNPSHSWIHRGKLDQLMKKAEYVVVQDMYHNTETAQQANLVLPAAGWGEKDGTVINSERRIGLYKKVRRAPGQALSDFYIFKLIADRWGCGDLFKEWSSPEAAFHILKRLSKGRPCDFSGIPDYQALDTHGGVQWPCPEERTMEWMKENPERRLFEDGLYYTPNQKARFIFEAPTPVYEPTCAEYPWVLLTGRGTSSQWHTQTRTKHSSVLRKLYPQKAYVELHPKDAEKLQVRTSEQVTIASRRGAITVRVAVSPSVQPGQIFVPMHYEETNLLTYPAFDPYSKQPSYKYCAVQIKKG